MGARYVSHTQTYLCNQRKHKNKIKMTKNTKSKCYNYIYRLSATQIQAEMSIIKTKICIVVVESPVHVLHSLVNE